MNNWDRTGAWLILAEVFWRLPSYFTMENLLIGLGMSALLFSILLNPDDWRSKP